MFKIIQNPENSFGQIFDLPETVYNKYNLYDINLHPRTLT